MLQVYTEIIRPDIKINKVIIELDNIYELVVEGDNSVIYTNEFFNYHLKKFHIDNILFLIFCEDWLKNRNVKAELKIMRNLNIIDKMIFSFILWLKRKVYNELGLESFELAEEIKED
ncbi:hypothetical protein [Thermosipho sp. (in: thermotogales)]|uniref:hypothetical protein n=1 Tax=Thermosipho sp. (in: thermotogales) TaxID=1968895 RepID=UPI00257F1549|nr:hypothetical protein [Thermosipho sp. (in: thermotogales)]MBZ4649248.1 hypothetical protein [Thermosipho sp. (in: thermotogales)]